VLVENGADVNRQVGHEWTPSMGAVSNGHIDMVKFLLSHGADPNARNNLGQTALDIAIKADHKEIADLLRE
jgi:ankyrin repeat protein